RRRRHQYRHHSQQNHPRSRASSFRIPIPEHLRRQLPREGSHHHGGPFLPRPQRHQDRNRRHPRTAFTQRDRRHHRNRELSRSPSHPGGQFSRPAGIPIRPHHPRHRHQARCLPARSVQQQNHHQQRPNPQHAGNSQSHDRRW